MTEQQILGVHLRKRYEGLTAEEFGWAEASSNILDCVLSLRRKYNSFVLPRVEAFRESNPSVWTARQLRAHIDKFESPAAFLEVDLDYRHPARATVLSGVVDYLLRQAPLFDGETELSRIRAWADWARPGDYIAVSVKGFGLAGFQYLRMLFGADTVKPDVHIQRFVGEVIDREVTNIEALYLLEGAAKEASLPIRTLDRRIWEERADSPKGSV